MLQGRKETKYSHRKAELERRRGKFGTVCRAGKSSFCRGLWSGYEAEEADTKGRPSAKQRGGKCGVRHLNVNSTARTVEGLRAHGPRHGLSLSEPGFGMGAWEARRPAQKQRLLCACCRSEFFGTGTAERWTETHTRCRTSPDAVPTPRPALTLFTVTRDISSSP